MKLFTLAILALSLLLISLPLHSNILIQALLFICILLVAFGIYKAVIQLDNDKDQD